MTRFTAADVDHANHDWLCSCGPAALAAICDLTLDEVKPHFQPAFPGWTTPSRMKQALRNAGMKWTATIETLRHEPGSDPRRTLWPRYGLARIQWHGPWTMPGASPRWAYTQTHWVGVSRLLNRDGSVADPDCVCIWDVNAMSVGEGWSPLAWWSSQVVPRLTREIQRATGGWHVTHGIEVEQPAATEAA